MGNTKSFFSSSSSLPSSLPPFLPSSSSIILVSVRISTTKKRKKKRNTPRSQHQGRLHFSDWPRCHVSASAATTASAPQFLANILTNVRTSQASATTSTTTLTTIHVWNSLSVSSSDRLRPALHCRRIRQLPLARKPLHRPQQYKRAPYGRYPLENSMNFHINRHQSKVRHFFNKVHFVKW